MLEFYLGAMAGHCGCFVWIRGGHHREHTCDSDLPTTFASVTSQPPPGHGTENDHGTELMERNKTYGKEMNERNERKKFLC